MREIIKQTAGNQAAGELIRLHSERGLDQSNNVFPYTNLYSIRRKILEKWMILVKTS